MKSSVFIENNNLQLIQNDGTKFNVIVLDESNGSFDKMVLPPFIKILNGGVFLPDIPSIHQLVNTGNTMEFNTYYYNYLRSNQQVSQMVTLLFLSMLNNNNSTVFIPNEADIDLFIEELMKFLYERGIPVIYHSGNPEGYGDNINRWFNMIDVDPGVINYNIQMGLHYGYIDKQMADDILGNRSNVTNNNYFTNSQGEKIINLAQKIII